MKTKLLCEAEMTKRCGDGEDDVKVERVGTMRGCDSIFMPLYTTHWLLPCCSLPRIVAHPRAHTHAASYLHVHCHNQMAALYVAAASGPAGRPM